MVSFTVRMRFRAEDHDEVEGILRRLTERSRTEPGCVTYVPHFVEGDGATVVIYEQYRNEAAVEAHRGTAHFQELATGGLYRLMLDRAVETLVAVA